MTSFIYAACRAPIINKKIRVIVSFEESKYPAWLDLITNDINHVIRTARFLAQVPSYNLREIYRNMKETESEGMINYNNVMFLIVTAVLALYGIFFTPVAFGTLVFTCIFYAVGQLCLNLGYHRLFSHKSYESIFVWKLLTVLGATSTFQGSCIDWCKDHRLHHKHADTENDPYNSKKDIFQSHIGWTVFKRDNDYTVVEDLVESRLLRVQHAVYPVLAVLTGIVFPTVLSGLLFNDYTGGFFFAAILRIVVTMQCTLSVNSLGYFGSSNYSTKTRYRDNFFLSLLTLGEGNENFHHTHPNDYRNGYNLYDFDPAKWIIKGLSFVGVTSNLFTYPEAAINACRAAVLNEKLEKDKLEINWGPRPEDLLEWDAEDVRNQIDDGKLIILIDGVCYDCTEFITLHPGGEAFLKAYKGRDATDGIFLIH